MCVIQVLQFLYFFTNSRGGHQQKKGVKLYTGKVKIKIVKGAFRESLSFCPSCFKCLHCYGKSSCWKQATKVLVNMGLSKFESKGGLNFKGGLSPDYLSSRADMPNFSGTATCRGIEFPLAKADNRAGQGSRFSGLVQ